MARHESDREDLMREAVALLRRVECEVPGEADSVVSGFRQNGWLSVYFGGDPVYHFDEEGRLRRAFAEGLLFRTQGTTLAQLERVRTESATELRRHDLTDKELGEFLAAMRTRLENFATALEAGEARVIAQVSAGPTLTAHTSRAGREAGGEGRCPPIVPELAAGLRRVLEQANPLAPPIRGKR